MRVVLTVNFSPWSPYRGGGQTSTHQLATALAERGDDVTVIYTKPPWEPVLVPEGLPYQIRWARLLSRRSYSGAPLRPLTAVAVAREVARIVSAEPDVVVHGQGEEAVLIGRLRRRHRFGFVMTPRMPSFPAGMADGSWRRSPRAFGYWLLNFRYPALGSALRAADRWCPTSRFSANEVQRVFSLAASRCRVVPNGLADPFLYGPSPPWSMRERRGVFFGRMSREKGIMTLVEALGRLGSESPRMLMIGDGPLRHAAEHRIAGLGLADRVRFVGWIPQDQLAQPVAESSWAFLPSWEESFGNAIAETMAMGTPLVSTRVGAVPELIDHDKTGLLVSPRDEDGLADAIRRITNDETLAARLGRDAARAVKQRFDWRSVAERFAEIYAEVVHERVLAR